MDDIWASLGDMTGLSSSAFQRRVETGHALRLVRDGWKVGEISWYQNDRAYALVHFSKDGEKDEKTHILHGDDLEQVRRVQHYQEKKQESN